ncbi:D-2-hydroxyacid dehydrogenase [Wandonia haliotis]|uniref:D-2-hydroxyacid dehydrogenase n=1 Tax=Wandonia haliotis TaxID=574963 RepID=A0ABN1MP54_9FLAO
MKVLANDGISPEGKKSLEASGYTVITDKVEQENLIDYINNEHIEILLVRSATTARKELIDACPNLKLIGRGGVGMDNIDVAYAREKGVQVINTPGASSQSVAELVMGQLFAISRSLHDSFRNMPECKNGQFAVLKKKYSKGVELRGKTLLIVGFGRIGQALAGYALGVGMKVIAADHQTKDVQITVPIAGTEGVKVTITPSTDVKELLPEADFISVHVPKQADGSAVFGKAEFNLMKEGVRIVNAARGGVIDEAALLSALNEGKIAQVALDVYENEPTPWAELLQHEKIACTPHIGAATVEAQDRIGLELADQIVSSFGSK